MVIRYLLGELGTHSSFTTPRTAGDVTVNVDFPADTTNWTKAELRRLKPTWSGTLLNWVSPTCTTGTVVKTWNGPTFADESFTDSTTMGSPGTVPGAHYMYTLCVYAGTTVAASYTTVNKPTRAWGGGTTFTVFLTSKTQAGNFPSYNGGAGGLVAADAMCQARGDTFSAGKTWKALLSTSTVNAASRVSGSGEVRNLIGTQIGSSIADLFDNAITAISYQDTFATSTTTQIWTGSTTSGTINTGKACTDWTTNSSGVSGSRGSAGSATGTWIGNTGSSSTCNNSRRIWCMTSTPD